MEDGSDVGRTNPEAGQAEGRGSDTFQEAVQELSMTAMKSHQRPGRWPVMLRC